MLEGAAILAIGVYFVASRAQWRDYDVLVYAFSGAAGLVLSFLLLRSRLVPWWLAILGIAGYAALLLSAASTALGSPTSTPVPACCSSPPVACSNSSSRSC